MKYILRKPKERVGYKSHINQNEVVVEVSVIYNENMRIF